MSASPVSGRRTRQGEGGKRKGRIASISSSDIGAKWTPAFSASPSKGALKYPVKEKSPKENAIQYWQKQPARVSRKKKRGKTRGNKARKKRKGWRVLQALAALDGKKTQASDTPKNEESEGARASSVGSLARPATGCKTHFILDDGGDKKNLRRQGSWGSSRRSNGVFVLGGPTRRIMEVICPRPAPQPEKERWGS